MNEDFIYKAKKAVSELKTISEILNAIPVNELHNRPPIVLNDGCTLSVQGKGSHNPCSCFPGTPLGPWENLEVGYPDREIARLMLWIEGGTQPLNTPDESVYHHVPAAILDEIIKDGGGVAGYLYEGEVVPIGQIRTGLMWLAGTWGNPTGTVPEYGGTIDWKEGMWTVHPLGYPLGDKEAKACYATKAAALAALEAYQALL